MKKSADTKGKQPSGETMGKRTSMAEMKMDPDMQEIRRLADEYLRGTISAAGRDRLEQWYAALPETVEWPEEGMDGEHLRAEMLGQIRERMQAEQAPVRVMRRYRWWAAAAVFLLMAGTGWWFLSKKTEQAVTARVVRNDVAPGHSGAILHLKSGTVQTDTLPDGLIAMEGGLKIIKENGMIRYEGTEETVTYHDFTTDKARTGELELPDGSRVWLNAASSVHYPTVFNGKERIVEVTGEVYFQVKHNPNKPFKVKVGNQVIEDIGTEFNVNGYTDEKGVVTTLVEGEVKVNGSTLKPGQQYLDGKVSAADVEQATAWRNGMFAFPDHSDLPYVLRQLARWYDVEVVYEGAVPQRSFGGGMQRNLNLSKVLAFLEQQHVKFRIEDKKLIVEK